MNYKFLLLNPLFDKSPEEKLLEKLAGEGFEPPTSGL